MLWILLETRRIFFGAQYNRYVGIIILNLIIRQFCCLFWTFYLCIYLFLKKSWTKHRVETEICRKLSCNFVFGATAIQWARASSSTMFLDHTQRCTTVGRTLLDEWSARRRDLCLTTHNTHNRQTSIPPVGFEPTISAGERPQTYFLVRAATGPWNFTDVYSQNFSSQICKCICEFIIDTCRFHNRVVRKQSLLVSQENYLAMLWYDELFVWNFSFFLLCNKATMFRK